MINALLSGSAVTLAVVVAVLFLRAFRRIGDRLFLLFALAFVTLAGQQLAEALTDRPDVNDPIAYAPRILAFGIILYAIVDRNRR